MLFTEFDLRPDLLQGVEALGFVEATEIQQLAIPIALNAELDLMALAQTGTGKTAAFGLPLLHNLDADVRKVQALVLCPTRELCIQVASDLDSYSKFSKKIKVVAVYGGAPISRQIRELKAGAQVIVATPGRLMDLMSRNIVDFDELKVVTMDEADEMLNMGFREDLEVILGNLPEDHATWLFSATMSKDVHKIAQKFMNNPTTIGKQAANKPNENIDHGYFVCKSSERYETLKRVLDMSPGIFGLVFCQTKREVQGLTEDLTTDGYNVDAIHGDLSQADRDRVMNRFRGGRLDLLIATDVAARGIDVDNITHVINFGFPYDMEAYTHRTGRTGRAGRKGTALSIVTKKFEQHIFRLERRTGTEVNRMEIPKQADIMQAQIKRFLNKIQNATPEVSDFQEVMPMMLEALEDMTKEQLLMYLAEKELGDILGFYRGKSDIFDGRRNDRRREGERGGRREERRSERGRNDRRERRDDFGDRRERREPRSRSAAGTTRIFINMGRIDGYDSGSLAKSITGNLNLPAEAIASVDVSKNFAHIDAKAEFASQIMKGMDGTTVEGRLIRANLADGGSFSRKPKRERKPRRSSGGDRDGDRGFAKSFPPKGGKKKAKKLAHEFF